MSLWRNSDRLLYGQDTEGGWSRSTAVTYGGQEGETVLLRANHYSSLAQAIVSMSTGTRLGIEAQAINNDYESEIAADLAKRLLTYYYEEKEMEDRYVEALECMLSAGECWVGSTWDTQLGEIYQFDQVVGEDETVTNRPVYEGDVNCTFRHPVDVVRDYKREDLNPQWLIIRSVVNRWDLLAEHPEQESAILSATLYDAAQREQWLWPVGEERSDNPDDLVTKWTLYHRPTAAMPVGRQTVMVNDAILSDEVLQYRELPFIPMVAWRKRKSAFGWSRMWDLIALQQAYDSIISTMVTNHDATGMVNFWNRSGDDLITEDLPGGVRHLQSAEEPKILKADGISNASQKLEEIILNMLQTISGVNSVARGNVPSNISSGAGLALVQSLAVEFNSPIQRAFGRCVERGLTHTVELLQKHANTPRFAQIVGRNGAPELKEFQGQDISAVRRVKVDLGAAATRTLAGRQQLGEALMQAQAPITPEQYMNIIRTGRLEDIEDPQRSARLNVKAENEMLMSGQSPKMMVTDNHQMHVEEHLAVLNNPKFRMNEPVSAAVVQHIQEHYEAWINSPPGLLVLSGQQPPDPSLLPPMLGGAPPPGPGGGAPPPEQQGNAGPSGGAPKADMPATKESAPGLAAKLPKMPKDPRSSGSNQPAKKG